jgi:hypothetical protein
VPAALAGKSLIETVTLAPRKMTADANSNGATSWIGPLFNGKTSGFIDWNAKWLLQIECDNLGDFQEGLAPFEREGKIGFINMAGVEVIKPTFTTHAIVLPGFREGFAPVEFNGSSTYIDSRGEVVAPLQTDTCLWNFFKARLSLARADASPSLTGHGTKSPFSTFAIYPFILIFQMTGIFSRV